MLYNYFKIALRNLSKNKLFSFINITGLSIGMAMVVLIMLFVKNEWTYDQFHANSDNIYRAWVKEHFKGRLIFNSVTPLILGPELTDNFPEVEAYTNFVNVNSLVRKGAEVEQEMVHFVHPSFFEIFDFKLQSGDPDGVFAGLHQAVITPELAGKYFDDENPIGKRLAVQISGEWIDFSISGIIEEPPSNSSLEFQILLPFKNADAFYSEGAKQCWTCVYGETYFQIDPNADLENLHSKIASFVDEKVSEDYDPGQYIVGMQPITDIHLNNEIPEGIAQVSDARYPYILASIALLILLLASINYTTLSIGRSVSRAKEVGVRKVAGAGKWQLRVQFWSEATVTSFIALIIGLSLAWLLLPFFNQLADQELVLTLSGQHMAFFIGLALLIGFLSGGYPAMVLSRFAPIQAIKGAVSSSGKDKHLILRYLVGFQFVLSIFLIICTFGMQKQMHFLQNKNLGFEKDQTIVVPFSGSGQGLFNTWDEARQVRERLNNDLAGSGVKQIISSSHTVGTPGWGRAAYTDQETDKSRQFYVQQIDEGYIPAMDIQLLEGRAFSKENPADKKAVIVNETFADAWELTDPIGATLPGPFKEYRIIGVAKDFNFSSLHSPVEPLVMAFDFADLLRAAPDLGFVDSPIPKFSFKVAGNQLPATIDAIKSSWKKVTSEQAFTFTFLDENIDRQYQSESKLSEILSFATFLAIIIACLGLFGIATLIIAQKTKEIGIRKVLGASKGSIVILLNKRFSLLVVIAALVATPISWYLLREWLSDFAYQTTLSWWVFALAAITVLVFAWLSVSYQSLRAAMNNPVDSLRSE